MSTIKLQHMNAVKKYAGIIWMALAIVSYLFLIYTSYNQIHAKPTTDTIVQWVIFDVIFLPINIGLLIFGWLAFKGDYDHLPESDEEIVD